MANIDLRDDMRAQIALSSNIGQGIGAGVGAMVGERRRQRTESALVSTLSQSAREQWTPEQTRQKILAIPELINTQLGQEMIAAQTGTGRYYQDPLQTQYLKSRINAADALAKSRAGANGASSVEVKRWNDIYKTAYETYLTAKSQDDTATMEVAQQQMEIAKSNIQSMGPGQPAAARMGTPNRVGMQVGDFMGEIPKREIPAQPQITQPPKPDIAADVMAGQAFTGEPPAGQLQKWQSQAPEQRRAYALGQETPADTAIASVVQGNEFRPYMDKLDADSRSQLERIIAEGNPQKIQIALQRLRETYGTL